MGPRAVLDKCGKCHPHRVSIPGPSSPYPVAIPTELPGPHIFKKYILNGFLNVFWKCGHIPGEQGTYIAVLINTEDVRMTGIRVLTFRHRASFI
jgi:hypothetical protein